MVAMERPPESLQKKEGIDQESLTVPGRSGSGYHSLRINLIDWKISVPTTIALMARKLVVFSHFCRLNSKCLQPFSNCNLV